VRIISGKWKGRQLVSFKANHIRPTTDRVKETLFNILQHDIPDSRILDLFGGTGNLSFESLSRGARFVELVESHKISLKIIQENMTK
jgi:16S rRNA (guanine966-N2)-methyltransferase